MGIKIQLHFFNLFILRELACKWGRSREGENPEQVREGQREGERERFPSRLPAVITEPNSAGSQEPNYEIMA